jgi:hypothetical protein
MDRAKKNVSDALRPFTLQPKGKGKQNKIGSMELFGFEKMQGNKPKNKDKKK